MALGHDDVRVGAWTSPGVPTGCTVVLPPPGTLGAVAVRGHSPGIRFAVSLGPLGKLQVCHGVVLTGGSAYGQATADGVTSWLEEQGVGYPVHDAVVPIVGAAHLLDGSVVAGAGHRPDAAAGRAAAEAATTEDLDDGAVGAGAGCLVAKVAGLEHAWRGGQGTAVRRHGDLVVGAIVANNAVGELLGEDGRWLLRARVDDARERYPLVPFPVPPAAAEGGAEAEGDGGTGASADDLGNTVIGCIVTNARLDKVTAHRVADLGHSGIDRAVRPSHTHYDGDALFCLATGRVDAHVDLVVHLAVEAVAEATRRGPMAARSHDDRSPSVWGAVDGRDGIPGAADA